MKIVFLCTSKFFIFDGCCILKYLHERNIHIEMNFVILNSDKSDCLLVFILISHQNLEYLAILMFIIFTFNFDFPRFDFCKWIINTTCMCMWEELLMVIYLNIDKIHISNMFLIFLIFARVIFPTGSWSMQEQHSIWPLYCQVLITPLITSNS